MAGREAEKRETKRTREREMILKDTGYDYGHNIMWNILSYEINEEKESPQKDQGKLDAYL